jgi:hypothetical protein
MNRKQWLYGDSLKNDAAYPWSHPHLPEKMARKSTLFFDKNQFANRRAFQVYCLVASLKIDVLRATTNGLFRQNDETQAFYSRHWRRVAVACPEWRGLKVKEDSFGIVFVLGCSGLPRMEGTESAIHRS